MRGAPKIPVHYPADSLTQSRLGGTQRAHKQKGWTSEIFIFMLEEACQKQCLCYLLKINCLKQYTALKRKFTAHSLKVLNHMALIHGGINACT